MPLRRAALSLALSTYKSVHQTMSLQVRSGRVEIDVPTDEHAKQCARVVKEHGAVKSLDLRQGRVTDVGAAAIAKAMKGAESAPKSYRSLQGPSTCPSMAPRRYCLCAARHTAAAHSHLAC